MKESNVKVNEFESLEIVKSVSSQDIAERRNKIESLELAMLQHDQVEIPVEHMFHGDIYARKIMIPKGTLLTGRIHKFDHFDIMISGDISVSTDTGEIKRLTGFNLMKGDKGKKRAGYAHEDTHWVTFHSAEERNPEDMYDFLTCGSFEEFEQFCVDIAKVDYNLMIKEFGLTQHEISLDVNNEEDLYSGIYESYAFIDTSEIGGKGSFSISNLKDGDFVAKARIGNKRTHIGRFTNHSPYPNAKMQLNDFGDVDLIAIKNISVNEEITVNYRDVISERLLKGDLCQQ